LDPIHQFKYRDDRDPDFSRGMQPEMLKCFGRPLFDQVDTDNGIKQ